MVETAFHDPQSTAAGTPDGTPDVVVLEGHVGPSDREDRVRLYTGLDCKAFYEIPRSGIERIERADHDNGPSRVFVKTVAVVGYYEAAQGGEESFLEGAIVAGNLADAVAVEARVFERSTVLIAGSNPPRKCHPLADPGTDELC
jgi:hypothetical protein